MGFRILLVIGSLCVMRPMNEVQGFSTSDIRTWSRTDLANQQYSSRADDSQNGILTLRRSQLLSGPLPSRADVEIKPSSTTSLSLSSSPSSTSSDVRRVVDWIMDKPLESLISKEETVAISRELTGDKALLDSMERAVVNNWDKIVEKLTRSSDGRRQTLSALLGEEATQRLLRGVQNLDVYSDSKTVNAFLQSEAVNDLFAQTLYDGIYEFFQTIDVFGNIISNLPVLGPIRNKIRDDLKQQLDRTLGPTLRSFLRGYTSIAIGRASSFVLSDQNRRAFGAANARLLKSVLDRPLQDLLPLSSNPSIAKLRSEFFGYLRQLGEEDSPDLEEYVALVYDLIGDKSLDSVGLNVHRVLDASPTLETTADRIFDEAINQQRSE